MMNLRTLCIFSLFLFCSAPASQTPKSARKYIALEEASVAVTFDSQGQPISALAVENDGVRVDPKTPRCKEKLLLDALTSVLKYIKTENINAANLIITKHNNGLIEMKKNPSPQTTSNSKNSKSLSSTT